MRTFAVTTTWLTDLAHAKRDLYEQLTRGRKLEEKIDTLQSSQTHAADTERQLAGKISEAELLAEQLRDANDQIAPIRGQLRELVLLLAQANAKLQAQEQIGEQMKAFHQSLSKSGKRTIASISRSQLRGELAGCCMSTGSSNRYRHPHPR